MGALMSWLSQNIKYPVIAAENGVEGRVIVQFVVEKDGSITDVKIAKSVDPSLDKEATRVVSSMPHWIAGRQNGNPVRVKYTVPVTFKLQ
jgi:protein TonB